MSGRISRVRMREAPLSSFLFTHWDSVNRSESVSRVAEEIPEEVFEKEARYWIETLQLEANPEGGYFRQTYKADLVMAKEALSGARGWSPSCGPSTRLREDRG